MTEKRFVDYFDKDHNYIIQDLQNEDEYQVGFVNCDEDELLNLLNALHEENQRLREIISANRTITIPYTITDEKLVKKLREMFKEDLDD